MAKAKEGKVIIYVEGTKSPVRATPWSWGIDLYASESISIGGNSIGVVGLGIKMNFNAQVAARSSLRKKNVIIANGIGIIDADYRGEVKAPLFNIKPYNVNISKGDWLCQILIDPEEEVEIRCVSRDEFDNRWLDNPTERGEGGFGSTDNQEAAPTEGQAEWAESDTSDEQLPSDGTSEWEENSEDGNQDSEWEADDNEMTESESADEPSKPAEPAEEKKQTRKNNRKK